MKKFLALLLTVAMVFAMAACSAPAAEETKPAEEGAAAPAEETSDKPAAAGSVYYLNFKPEASKNLIHLGGDAGTSIGNSGNSGSGHCNLIGQLCIFKSKKAGHDLHRASREKHFICILGIEHRIGGILHHYSCL